MDVMLVFVTPLAFIKDIFSQPKRKKSKNKAIIVLRYFNFKNYDVYSCCLFSVLFVVAYFLFFKYIEIPDIPDDAAETVL